MQQIDQAKPSSPSTQSANSTNKRSLRTAIVAALVIVLGFGLAGCWNGQDAGTQQVGPSGDGANADIGQIMIRNAVWVRSKSNPKNLTLSATFANNIDKSDELTSVSTDPKSTVTMKGGPVELGAIGEAGAEPSRVSVGFQSDQYINAENIDVIQSGYVATTFTFKNAGSGVVSILVVPEEGDYANIQSK